MIPRPSRITHTSDGAVNLQPFSGPPEIADLLNEYGLPVAGDWSTSDDHGAEGYRLRISQEGLQVRGRLAGLRWAVQTLRQVPLTSTEILDQPRYPWRGSLLDVARWCLPIEFLYKYVDLLALYKLNRLHLHLTDDQGWRFEVKRYPRLTSVGGFRPGHGGFYTQEQLKDLVAYARRRGVEIMPEIDLPGHTQAAIAGYPELGLGPVEVSTRWGIHDAVLNTKPATVEFFKHVLDEVADVFPFEYVHLGGDEVRSDVDGLLGWWIAEMTAHLRTLGRKCAVWDEVLDAGPPPGVLCFGWRDATRAPAASEAGFDAVSCPQEYAYFDWADSDRPGEPRAINGFVPLEKVYSFEPGDVTGVQGQLWTEYLPTPDLVEYRAFPRLAALAEVGWSTSARDYPDFDRRLRAHLPLLDSLGVNYRPLD